MKFLKILCMLAIFNLALTIKMKTKYTGNIHLELLYEDNKLDNLDFTGVDINIIIHKDYKIKFCLNPKTQELVIDSLRGYFKAYSKESFTGNCIVVKKHLCDSIISKCFIFGVQKTILITFNGPITKNVITINERVEIIKDINKSLSQPKKIYELGKLAHYRILFFPLALLFEKNADKEIQESIKTIDALIKADYNNYVTKLDLIKVKKPTDYKLFDKNQMLVEPENVLKIYLETLLIAIKASFQKIKALKANTKNGEFINVNILVKEAFEKFAESKSMKSANDIIEETVNKAITEIMSEGPLRNEYSFNEQLAKPIKTKLEAEIDIIEETIKGKKITNAEIMFIIMRVFWIEYRQNIEDPKPKEGYEYYDYEALKPVFASFLSQAVFCGQVDHTKIYEILMMNSIGLTITKSHVKENCNNYDDELYTLSHFKMFFEQLDKNVNNEMENSFNYLLSREELK
jgi:hypothetical protein